MLTSENLPVAVLRCSALPVSWMNRCVPFSQPSTCTQASHYLLFSKIVSANVPHFPMSDFFSSPEAPPAAHKHNALPSDHRSLSNYCPFPCSLYSTPGTHPLSSHGH